MPTKSVFVVLKSDGGVMGIFSNREAAEQFVLQEIDAGLCKQGHYCSIHQVLVQDKCPKQAPIEDSHAHQE